MFCSIASKIKLYLSYCCSTLKRHHDFMKESVSLEVWSWWVTWRYVSRQDSGIIAESFTSWFSGSRQIEQLLLQWALKPQSPPQWHTSSKETLPSNLCSNWKPDIQTYVFPLGAILIQTIISFKENILSVLKSTSVSKVFAAQACRPEFSPQCLWHCGVHTNTDRAVQTGGSLVLTHMPTPREDTAIPTPRVDKQPFPHPEWNAVYFLL